MIISSLNYPCRGSKIMMGSCQHFVRLMVRYVTAWFFEILSDSNVLGAAQLGFSVQPTILLISVFFNVILISDRIKVFIQNMDRVDRVKVSI
jgi:hypothetical protein